HGFSIGPIAKKLKLASDAPPGVLIVGASSFSIALADALKNMYIPVLISDSSYGRLFPAISLGIETHHGEILSEHAQFNLDLTPYETILVMTGDAAYNALVSQSYVPEFGYNNTFSLVVQLSRMKDQKDLPMAREAHLLFDAEASFKELNKKINTGYSIKSIEVTDVKTSTLQDLDVQGTPLFIKRKDDTIEFITLRPTVKVESGDEVFVLSNQ